MNNDCGSLNGLSRMQKAMQSSAGSLCPLYVE